jgi:hypothetical protein
MGWLMFWISMLPWPGHYQVPVFLTVAIALPGKIPEIRTCALGSCFFGK